MSLPSSGFVSWPLSYHKPIKCQCAAKFTKASPSPVTFSGEARTVIRILVRLWGLGAGPEMLCPLRLPPHPPPAYRHIFLNLSHRNHGGDGEERAIALRH